MRYAKRVVFSLIVLVAIVSSVARLGLPLFPQYVEKFQEIAKEAIDKPIQIDHADTSWAVLTPVLRFYDVAIMDQQTMVPEVVVDEIQVGISLWRSLLAGKVELSFIRVNGVRLTMQQDANNHFRLLGLPQQLQRGHSAEEIEPDEWLGWLLTRKRLAINNVHINLWDSKGRLLPIEGVNLLLTNSLLRHHLAGTASLNQAIPSQIKFSADFKGGVTLNKLKGQFYLDANDFVIEQWLGARTLYNLKAKGGVASSQVWGEWRNGGLHYVHGTLDLKDLDVTPIKSKKTSKLEQISAHWYWQQDDSQWQLKASPVNIEIDHHNWPVSSFNFSKKGDAYAARIDYIRLDDLSFLKTVADLFPESINYPLHELKPGGAFSQVNVNYQDPKSWRVSARVHNLRLKPLMQLPGFDGIDGVVHVAPEKGWLTLKTYNGAIELPGVFTEPMPLAKLVGQLDWYKKEDHWLLTAKEFELQDDNVGVRADFNLQLPLDGSSPWLELLARLNVQSARKLHHYLPNESIMDKSLFHWLSDSIVDVDNLDATAVIVGRLRDFPYGDKPGRFVVDAPFEYMKLKFLPDWPVIDRLRGRLTFDSYSMLADLEHGETHNGVIQEGQVTIANLNHSPEVKVDALIAADLQDGLQYVQDSELKHSIGEELGILQAHGPMQLSLDLNIPLHDHVPVEYQGQIDIADSTLELPDWELTMEDLSGALTFDASGVNADMLNAKLLGGPIAASLQTKQKDGQRLFQIDALGHAINQPLYEHFGFPLLNYFSPRIPYRARLTLPYGDGDDRLLIKSDLAGVDIALPKPFGKSVEQDKSLSLLVTFGKNTNTTVRGRYGNDLSAYLQFEEAGQELDFSRGQIRFGDMKAVLPESHGLQVVGKLETFDWNEWRPFFGFHPLAAGRGVGHRSTVALGNWADNLDYVDLTIDNAHLFSRSLKDLGLHVSVENSFWKLGLDSARIKGHMFIPEDLNISNDNPLIVKLDELYLDKPKKKADKKMSSQLLPNQLPPLKLDCAKCRYGDKEFSNLTFNLHRKSTKPVQAVTIDKLSIDSPMVKLKARGEWQYADSKHSSRLYGEVNSRDLTKALDAWGLATNIEGSQGTGMFSLGWSDAIYKPDVPSLAGEVSMSLGHGRLIDVGDSAKLGAGKVLSLFSLRTLPRRLMLDFSDMTKDGFSFDIMRGHFILSKGQAYTRNAYFDGPIARVAIQGDIDLVDKDLDLKINITPHVTSSVPVLTAVVINPLAGAAAWVADTVLGKSVDKLTTYVYTVKGDWDEPVVEEVSSSKSEKNREHDG